MKRFEKAIVIGGTGLLYQAAEIMLKADVSDEVWIYECNTNGIAKKVNEQIKIRQTIGKKCLMEALAVETKDSLVLSVMNPYIITPEVIDNPSLLILNLHHALLPYHRGRNCEAWAIYNGDSQAGITWHKVDAGVDTGEIYIQKSVNITEKTTSLKLLTQLNKISLTALEEMIAIGFDNLTPTVINDSDEGQLHMLKDRPNDAQLDLEKSGEEISRFLRSMDYGILSVLGEPFVIYNDQRYTWKSYSIKPNDSIIESVEFINKEDALHIIKAGFTIILKQMKGN